MSGTGAYGLLVGRLVGAWSAAVAKGWSALVGPPSPSCPGCQDRHTGAVCPSVPPLRRRPAASHVERPTRMSGGMTYCACGSPWPCDRASASGEEAS